MGLRTERVAVLKFEFPDTPIRPLNRLTSRAQDEYNYIYDNRRRKRAFLAQTRRFRLRIAQPTQSVNTGRINDIPVFAFSIMRPTITLSFWSEWCTALSPVFTASTYCKSGRWVHAKHEEQEDGSQELENFQQ